MAFFLIGRGPEDDLRVLSESFFESRQEAMAELSRISAEPDFSQWDTDVFVLDLEQGVPVLLVRPLSVEAPMSVGAQATSVVEAEAVEDPGAPLAWDVPEPLDDGEPIAEEAPEVEVQPASEQSVVADEPADEPAAVSEDEAERGDLRDAIQRTTEHMSAEGIVPPASAGLGATDEDIEAQTEAEVSAEASEVEPDAAPEEDEQVATEAELDASGDNAWPWAATPPAPETGNDAVSPDIATVYEALEADASAALVDEAAAEGESGSEASDAEGSTDDSDFILDLDAIQPVALDENPAQEAGAEESPATTETAEPIPAEAPGEDSYSSTLTDYTCEDCVYVETCPNRDQRAPKDCGSFQWK